MTSKNYLSIYAKSFNWAGFFLPKETYKKCSALYDFCRVIDNIADEKNQIKTILTDQLNLETIKADEILEETISNSSEQIEIWSKTNDIRKELDYDERLNILELMWEIVLVDDVLDVFEAQLMRRVSGLLYITDVDSGNSKKRALMKLKDNNL